MSTTQDWEMLYKRHLYITWWEFRGCTKDFHLFICLFFMGEGGRQQLGRYQKLSDLGVGLGIKSMRLKTMFDAD